MDYRDTEDFARRMEAAELRAHALRDQALDEAWAAIVRTVRGWLARLVHRTRDELLPEA